MYYTGSIVGIFTEEGDLICQPELLVRGDTKCKFDLCVCLRSSH